VDFLHQLVEGQVEEEHLVEAVEVLILSEGEGEDLAEEVDKKATNRFLVTSIPSCPFLKAK
jgi:hypothetical protein